uniref:Heme transporter HRG1-like n=1 Tax=Saccoglossus kowalevskii TaxID=10224 RepID=A0ABM0MX96_SACKO|nr:PREDICTED: heme transporter HRG1-like [Saccoglossus kowalevskii]
MCFRLTYSIIGILLGIIALFVFAIVYGSYHAASWGGISSVFSAIVFFLHIQHIKEWWRYFYHWLSYLELLGFIVMLGCLPAFGVYMSYGIIQHQHITPIEKSSEYYVTLVWVFMTWKWSLLLFVFARSYRRLYNEEYVLPPFVD